MGIVSRLAVLAMAAGALLCACEDPPPGVDLCIRGDLGRYCFERVRPLEDGVGCRADYRDPEGRRATVWVVRDRPEVFGEGGVPATFEKHVVYKRLTDEGIELGWHHGPLGLRLFLEGAAVPEGPVLRAYLFEYHSQVEADLEAIEKQVEDLRAERRRRPKDAAVHLELARKHRKLGEKNMAIQEYHVCVDADPKAYPCYLDMATLYRELRHWDLAIRALRRAAAIEPAEPAPRLLLGDIHYQVHNGQQALINYARARELGLDQKDRARVEKRLAELRAGKYMIEVLPGARKPPGGDGRSPR